MFKRGAARRAARAGAAARPAARPPDHATRARARAPPRSPSPLPLGAPRRIGEGCKFHAFATNTYKLHFLESPSGMKVRAAARLRVVTCGHA